MQSKYPAGPSNVPADLTKPTSSFKQKVFLAIVGLIFFVGTYLFLMCWFGIQSYHLFSNLGNNENSSFFTLVLAVFQAFLSFFMLKSLFIFGKKDKYDGYEIKAADEPLLFDFIHKLADEAKAPRPHKVYLSERVNASVFYDLNIFNLLFPSKKNLEIGLGLVNVLNIGEFKAILAHEFGHFAQRSMLLGRYVYTAQQIALRVINKRDAFDSFLSGLSRIDIRIAWIGWILSILVWAIRSLIEVIFSIVSVSERALSREMEFQADLVSVSLTGSDALIHALYKLRSADEGFHAALDFMNVQLNAKKSVPDMFALQSNYIDKMRWILNDSSFGVSPSLSADKSTRVFTNRHINPPEMWSTHPADNLREDNAKNIYIRADINSDSSWDLFRNPSETKKKLTAELVKNVKIETELLSIDESIRLMNEEDYNWTFLNPKYQGIYLSRFTFQYYDNIDEVYNVEFNEDVAQSYAQLYPDVLKEGVDKLSEIKEEIGYLELAKNEVVTAEKRNITHRGNRIKKREIPLILSQLKADKNLLIEGLKKHDKKARNTSYNAAIKLGPEMGSYVKSISKIIHFSEHSLINLQDVYSKFNNILQISLADGRVSSSELSSILKSSNELFPILKSVFVNSEKIELGKDLQSKLKCSKCSDLFEEFTLKPALKENIESWVNVIDGWIHVATNGLLKLRNAALEHLLDTEDTIKKAFLQGKTLEKPVENKIEIENYATLKPGEERNLQYKLGLWDRFHTSDGLFPTIAKFGVAASIIGVTLFFGNQQQKNLLYLYNGLSIPVNITIEGSSIEVDALEQKNILISSDKTHLITACNLEGDTIEHFEAISAERGMHIYNIAQSASFVEYEVTYGYDSEEPAIYLGSPRWAHSNADYIFEEAPKSLSTNSDYLTKSVFASLENYNPTFQSQVAQSKEEFANLALNHAKWDDENSPNYMSWVYLACQADSTLSFLYQKIKNNPNNVYAWRALQDYTDENGKKVTCDKLSALSNKEPNNADLYYLKTRCMENSPEQDRLIEEGHAKWPENSWLGFASFFVHANNENWSAANKSYSSIPIGKTNIAASIANDAERVIRLLRKTYPSKSFYNINSNEQIEFYNSLENFKIGNALDNASDFNTFYSYLSAGKLNLAIEHVNSKFPAERKYANWFIAASKNAPKNIVNEVLNYSTVEGIDANTAWIAAGLFAKHNKNYDSLLMIINEYHQINLKDKNITRDFIRSVKQGNTQQAELLLKKSDFRYKNLHYLIGVIILENKAPKKWKLYCDRMLYATEKPYLGKI